MFNYVNRLLIGKSTGSNTGTSITTIAPGDILFLHGDTQEVLTPATIAALPNNVAVYAAMGIELGKPRLSSPIRRREVRKFTREPYRAAVTQQDDVTLTGMTAGKKYRLMVVLLDEFKVIANRQTKLEIPAFIASGDATADANKLAAMVTKFKATYGLIKGSVVGGKLRIEGQPVPSESVLDDYQIVAFKTVFTELEDPTLLGPTGGSWASTGINQEVVTVRKADAGSGVAAQLNKLEREASGYLGNNDLRSFDRPSLASRLDPTGNYDIIHLLHFDRHQGDHEFTMESPVQTTFATVTGSAMSTFVETMLKAFLNKDAAATTTSAPDPDIPGGTSPE